MTTPPTTVAEELNAMRRLVVALDKLDRDAQDRVVTWLWDRYRKLIEDESEVPK